MAIVETLTKELAERLVGDLVRLDQLTLIQSGRDYCDESWAEQHFLMDVPGKWEHSVVALEPESGLLGFVIASRSPHSAVGVYLHRIATDPGIRGGALGRELLQALLDTAVRVDASRVTTSVSTSNAGGIRFFKRAGFRRLNGPEVTEIVHLRGMPSLVVGDCIQETTGHHKYLLGLDLD